MFSFSTTNFPKSGPSSFMLSPTFLSNGWSKKSPDRGGMGVKGRELSDSRQVIRGVQGHGTRSLTSQPPTTPPGSLALRFWWLCRGRSHLHSSVILDFGRKLTFALTISSNPHGSMLVWHGESWPKRIFLFFLDMGRRPTVFYRKGALISMYQFRLLQVAVLKEGRREAVGDHTSGHLKHCNRP